MRKLFAIFIVCSTLLFSILFCYADEQTDMKKDLPLALKYETQTAQMQLGNFETEAKKILLEQQLNMDLLSSLYYLGYAYTGSFDGHSLERSISLSKNFYLDAPIYRSDIFKGYYKLRAERLIKQYSTLQVLDYGALTKAARQDFDNYIKASVTNAALKENLTVLLQEKLMDKLIDLEPGNRKAALDEIYSLRLPANVGLCNDYLYESFEYGTRLQVLSQILEANREKIFVLSHAVALNITSEKRGTLLLQYVDSKGKIESLQVLSVNKAEQGYNGMTVVGELIGKKDGRLVFIDEAGKEQSIDIDRALEAVSLDDKGFLRLSLEGLPNEEQPEHLDTKVADSATDFESQIKPLLTLYNSKTAEAQVIIKELNRYSMYLELKKTGITNNFVRTFETNKKSWKTAMNARIEHFGPGGMADFAAYIKQFELADRSDLGRSEEGRLLAARFRNSVVQFRKIDDSSVWITDMLYNLKYMN